MQSGIVIDTLKLPNLTIEKLYIKWDKKINLSVKSIEVTKSSNQKTKPLNIKEISYALRNIGIFSNLFESVMIQKITFNQISVTFRYTQGNDGFLIASSPKISLKSNLSLSEDFLHIKLTEFRYFPKDLTFIGDIVIDNTQNLLDMKLTTNIMNDAFFDIYLHANQSKLFYTLKSKKDIVNFKPIVRSLGLHEDVAPWIVDAIKTSSIDVKYLYGSLEYKKIDKAMNNLVVIATLKNLDYTFDKEVEPVKTTHTDLIFIDGILNIHPHNAKMLGHELKKSWLKIDLNNLKDPILTLYLLVNTQFDEPLRKLLNHYKIPIPFIQNEGSTESFLKIPVHLINVRVAAYGYFKVKKGRFNYLGMDLNVSDADIDLDNLDVNIHNLSLGYHKQFDAKAKVNGILHLGQSSGHLDFDINEVKVNDILTLDTNSSSLKLRYHIDKGNDQIQIQPSQWMFNEHTMHVDALDIPFNLERVQANIPATYVNLDGLAKMYVQGNIKLKEEFVSLEVDLLDLDYAGISLAQSNVPLVIIYNKKLRIMQPESSYWRLNNTPLELEPSVFTYDGSNFSILRSKFILKNIMKGRIKGHYNLLNGIGVFDIKDYTLQNRTLGQLFQTDKTFNIVFRNKDDNNKISIPKYNIEYKQEAKGWHVDINDVAPLVEDSTLLQEYNITNGSVSLYSKTGTLPFYLKAKTSYAYPFMVRNNRPIYNYVIEGTVNKKSTNLTVNDALKVVITKEVTLTSKKVGYNLPTLIDFVTQHQNKQKEHSPSPNIFFKAKDSYLYMSSHRKALAQQMKLSLIKGKLHGELKHHQGGAIFDLEANYFDFFGKSFNADFMQELFDIGKINGGSMAFNFRGEITKFNGLVEVKNTTLIDYKLLNNMLAFINTIPSLATLSLPDYSTKGLAFDGIYAAIGYDEGNLTITDLYMNSRELDIFGEGSASFVNNSIDLNVKIKTDLGSKFSKVPVLGHIILGDDESIATSLDITGKLDNPKVSNGLASDMIIAPFNIIKRTLTLPFHLFTEQQEKQEDTTKK